MDDIFRVGGDKDLDSFVVRDDDFPEPNFNEISYMSRQLAQENEQRMLGYAREAPAYEYDEDLQDTMIRYGDLKQKRAFKRMRMFMDLEAEEGEEDDDDDRASFMFDWLC